MLRAAVSSTSEGHRHVIIRNNASILAPSRRPRGRGTSSSTTSFFKDGVKRNSLPAETVNQQHTQHHQHDNYILTKKTSAEAAGEKTEDEEEDEEVEDEDEDEDEEEEIAEGLREDRVITQQENRFIDVDIKTKTSDAPMRRLTHLYYMLERLQYQFPLHFRHPISKHWELVDKMFKVTEEYSKLNPPKRNHQWLNSVSILSRLAVHEN